MFNDVLSAGSGPPFNIQHSTFNTQHSSLLMKALITVELKPSVLDPQGKAIQHSLSSLGFAGVEDVRAGKVFKITIADSEQSREQVEAEVRQMCERLLANTVIENFSYTLEE